MLKLKAAICDDDTKHTQDIVSKLEQYDVVHDANISYQAFDKPTELLHLYKTGERFDILFLDIEMEAINGLTLAEKSKKWIGMRSLFLSVFILLICRQVFERIHFIIL